MAEIRNLPYLEFEKVEGRIKYSGQIPDNSSILLVEDVFTKGTACSEMTRCIRSKNIRALVAPDIAVFFNRSGDGVFTGSDGVFSIHSHIYRPILDWAPDECPLCKVGSVPIQPKETEENWELLTNSQR
jgi:hypothetical protein